MDKRNENIEDIFGKGFKDFKPKTSEKFDKKMIAYIGLPLVGTITFASIAKAIFGKLAAWVKALGFAKTLVIVTVSVVVIIATLAMINLDSLTTTDLTNEEMSQTEQDFKNKTPNKTTSDIVLDGQSETNEIINDANSKSKVNELDLINSQTKFADSQASNQQNTNTDDKSKIEKMSSNNNADNSQKDLLNVIPVFQEEVVEDDVERESLIAIDTPVDGSEDASIDKFPKEIQPKFAFAEPVNVPDTLENREDEQLIPKEATDFEALERNEIFKFSNYHKYADVYFMPFMFRNSFANQLVNSDSVIEQHISETPQLSFLFGFDFHLQHKQRPWSLNMGLNYQVIKENVDYHFKIAYDGEVPSYWEYDSTIYYVINPPNIDTIYAVDSAYHDHWTKEEAYKSSSNSYQYLNVPLLIGYNFSKKRSKVNVELATGIAMALRLKSTGYLYNNFGDIINYHDVNIKPTVDWYYLASIGVYYKQAHITMFLQPSIKYQLNKTTIDHAPLKRRYFIYGLRFGVRIKLF